MNSSLILTKVITKLKTHRSNIKLVQCAIKQGLDINETIFDGFTLLDNAVLLSDKKMIEFLLNHGANPNLCNQYGQLPLEKVYEEDIMKLFLSYHANIEKENLYQRTAIMQNLWQGNLDVAKLLFHLGASIHAIKWHEVENSIRQEAYDYFLSHYEKQKLEHSIINKSINNCPNINNISTRKL
jgi:ankyrin repeat protein